MAYLSCANTASPSEPVPSCFDCRAATASRADAMPCWSTTLLDASLSLVQLVFPSLDVIVTFSKLLECPNVLANGDVRLVGEIVSYVRMRYPDSAIRLEGSYVGCAR